MEKSDSIVEKELVQKRLKYYLGMFYVKPDKTPKFKQGLESLLKAQKSSSSMYVKVKNRDQLLQVGQAIILSYGKFVDYKAVNTYQLVEEFIQGDSILSEYSTYEMLIIYHGMNEMPNRQLHNITNQLVSLRAVKRLPTWVLSTKDDSAFGTNFFTFGNVSASSEEI